MTMSTRAGPRTLHAATVARANARASDSPTLVGRYRVLRRIGSGATAEVFLAERCPEPQSARADNDGTPPRVALKLLRPDLPAEVIGAFRDEFRVMRTLEHPGLTRVFEFGEHSDGRAFYAAELIEGVSLRNAAAPSFRDTCVAMAIVSRTLGYLHSRALLHNDVKPSNIIVGDTPETARLLDFGLSGLDQAHTRTVSGTVGYLSPERLAGRAWDSRADLYGVGATLFRSLAGQCPYDTSSIPKALAALARGEPRIVSLRPDLPAPLIALIDQLLAHEPSRRPSHAFEVVTRLAEVVGEVIPLQAPNSARCYALAGLLGNPTANGA
jgi:serine/threonine-protein kinase